MSYDRDDIDDRDALGMTAAERAEVFAATTLGGERGALAALVLAWPPAPIRHVAMFAGKRNVGSGDAKVQKAARALERALRRGTALVDPNTWGGSALDCPLCGRSDAEIRRDALHASSRARPYSGARYREDGAPSLAAACVDCFFEWYDGGSGPGIDDIRAAVLAAAERKRAAKMGVT